MLCFALLLLLPADALAQSDCNDNGVADAEDISAGTSADANANGVPDECERCQANQNSKLTASDAAAGDWFAAGVALDDHVAVVGSPFHDALGFDAGSAYVYTFKLGQWTELQRLNGSDSRPLDHFGQSVSVDGDFVVVGAPDDDDAGLSSGAAYVFQWDSDLWVEKAKLTASDAAAGDLFGNTVAVSGDLLVVGAPLSDAGGFNAGAAYVFRFDGASWVAEARLIASDAEAGDEFGSPVAVSGDAILVGARFDDDAGDNSGAAYVYRLVNGSWVEEAKLTASDAAGGDTFGKSLSLRGDLAVIGSPNDDDGGANSGSAYVFQFNGTGWVAADKLNAFDAAPGDRFGDAVAGDGAALVVGSSGDDDGGANSGSLYAFWYDGASWFTKAKLTASDAAAGDAFGVPVALRDDVAIVAALQDDEAGFSSGSAYVFRGLSDCNANDTLDICDVAGGASADLNGNGLPDECDPDCNANAVPDDLDLANATSSDCNANGVPDECEISAGSASDCDRNGVPDECDPDSDGDGVIDACDACPNTPAGAEVDPNGCGLVEPVADLDLTAMCSQQPSRERRWRIRNPNVFDVEVDWEIDGSEHRGRMMAPPHDSFLETPTVAGRNAAVIRWVDGAGLERSVQDESSGAACDEADSDGDGVFDRDDYCRDTPAGAAVDPHGCAKGELAELCHVPPGNPDSRHTIHVSPSAVKAHLKHGDSLGSCEGFDVDDSEGQDEESEHGDDEHDGNHDRKDGKDDPSDDHSEDDRDDRDDRYYPAGADSEEYDDLTPILPGSCGAGALGLLPLTMGALLSRRRGVRRII